jgi:hypothetical protein
MGIQWIRDNYRVPAKRGGRVKYTGHMFGLMPKFGTITGARNSHLRIRIDGQKHSLPFHPTWCIQYLEPKP